MHPCRTFAWTLFVAMVANGIAVRAQDPLTRKIDAEIKAAWDREKVKPAAKSTDAEFVRRIYLDLVGTIPSYEETKKFLADPEPDKRKKLIDSLLASKRFCAAQADVWDLVLFGRHPQNAEATRKRDGFKKWLAERIEKKEPLDGIVKKLLLGEEDGSEMFLVQYKNAPEEATVAVTRVFLGLQLQCARCHDHPFAIWTQRDFYGMAGFFVRVVVADGGGSSKMRKFKIGEKSVGEVLFTGAVKDQKPGQKGEPIRPKFLGGDVLDEPPAPKDAKKQAVKEGKLPPRPAFSRKQKIAEWVTKADNPYFARAMANRIWAQFMGRGFVNPVDDLGGKLEPTHPELLDALAKHLKETKFDLKDIIRAIVLSDAYQLSSVGPSKDAAPEWYERARVRPLSAEELWTSFKIAAQTPADAFKGSGEPMEYVVRFFGEPTDGLGHFQGSLAEHLFLNNAQQLRQMAQSRKGNLAEAILAMKAPSDEKVDRMFLSILSRPPSEVERKRFVEHLAGDAKMKPVLVEEAIWTLMSCSEFRFNH
ncbi:MAG TPA: DUF1549 and DUF1553 domain-containing protein [Gemmataceae bacterium]|jgi:hypothetical protein|nr:DUF1549 and DUF1553 domain-containing protein [Gemmataceae bacterium]